MIKEGVPKKFPWPCKLGKDRCPNHKWMILYNDKKNPHLKWKLLRQSDQADTSASRTFYSMELCFIATFSILIEMQLF